MLDWNDPKWQTLKGGYRVPFDPRPLLRQLEASPLDAALWDKLFQNLYHQGDIGEASYASVPEIARLIVECNAATWDPLNAVVAIELARTFPQNPPVPDWLEPAYSQTIEKLARHCLENLGQTTEPVKIRLMLSFLTAWKGLPVHANAFTYSESDLTHYFENC
jgi:hypothetical protein